MYNKRNNYFAPIKKLNKYFLEILFCVLVLICVQRYEDICMSSGMKKSFIAILLDSNEMNAEIIYE